MPMAGDKMDGWRKRVTLEILYATADEGDEAVEGLGEIAHHMEDFCRSGGSASLRRGEPLNEEQGRHLREAFAEPSSEEDNHASGADADRASSEY
jgi:hypothetical protein